MRLTRNTFSKGKNTDVDKQQIDPVFATDIQNLELVSDGNFLALTNIRGTTSVENIINLSNTEVLGIFKNEYRIDGVSNVKCLTIFTANQGGLFKIWCYNTINDDLYELYEETIVGDYFTDDRVIDAVKYAENGIDILYFTDYFNEIRQLRCEISSYSANFLNENDLSLQKRGANGTVDVTNVSTGGSLLSGTYQFAYRMVDPTKKKFTKWSSLTNPIHVYVTTSNSLSYSGIGLPSDKKITLDIVPTAEELANFPNFQLAVIENIYPINGGALTAALLPVELIADISSYEYKNNNKIGTVPIEDIVVDLAPIETVKTLNVKLNKLFAGNIKYRNLELDNGIPSISMSSISSIDVEAAFPATFYHEPLLASRQKGYFRDEVYRFGIVYYDKYGNHSAPVALDMSSVTGNQISGSTDMKFPSRATSNAYSILNNNDSPRVLGLNLRSIGNHPTWAVSFEIVRVKRIKRILFQTPVIPTTSIEGIGAFSKYPTLAILGDDEHTEKSFPDAQPMTSSKVLVAKNLFIPERREIQNRTTTAGSDANKRYKGEDEYVYNNEYSTAIIFPQSTMYGDTPFVWSGSEKLEGIDFCITRLNVEEFSEAEVTQNGGFVNTRVAGNFYALRNGDYFFDSTHSKSLFEGSPQIVDYAYIDNLSGGAIVAGQKAFQFDELSTKGITIGYEPTNQKMAVIKLNGFYQDENTVARAFTNATKNSYATGGHVFGSSGIRFQPQAFIAPVDNRFVTEYNGFVENSSYVQTIRIANVIRGEIGDDRYGNPTDQHEYISTGAKYTFSPSELVDVAQGNQVLVDLDVWGGDCFVGFHTFKVADSVYSITNVTKNNNNYESTPTLSAKWDVVFNVADISGSNPKLMMPVALEKAAQFIQLFLESEYNGEVMDYDVLVRKTSVSSTPILNVSSESSIRSPLTYKYNFNLSKENDQKVFLSEPENFVQQNDFESRIVISDPKIYNSDVQGFDTFRVLNFFDLEESGGSLTKLALAGDQLYAVQENRISYLPVGATQIEQTDGGTLAVGTGSDIGRPIVIDTEKGGQHLRGIVETGSSIYIPDNNNKAIYIIGQQSLEIVSDLFNATDFRSKFALTIPEKNLIGIYDPIRKEYWIANNSSHFCERFNEILKVWKGNYEFSSAGSLQGGVFTNQALYLMGKVGNQIAVHTMYTGDCNQLFGQTVTPRASFVVNPDAGFSKTFDVMMFEATERLATVDLTVEREAALSDQTVVGMIIAVPSQEGNYRVKTMRDASSARLRGLRMLTTVKWSTENVISTLTSVYTKYRFSARSPF